MHEADEPMKGAVCMDKGTKTTALRPRLQGEVAAEFAEILPAVERWHQMAIQHSRIAIWCAACCGQELTERKKEIGHGGWMKFLQVLPFGRTTAEKYMTLAEEWRDRTGQIPTAGGNLKPALLAGGSRAMLELTADQYTEIAEQTERTVGETTLRQLYFDWGICKPPYKPGGNMRNAPLCLGFVLYRIVSYQVALRYPGKSGLETPHRFRVRPRCAPKIRGWD